MRNETILIICAEDKIIVEKETLRLAKNLFKKIENAKKDQINLKNISKKTILKIIEYCEHHRNKKPNKIQIPLKSSNLQENGVSKWDSDFVNFENIEDLSDLIILAKLFEIDELLKLTCAKFASILRDNEFGDCNEFGDFGDNGCL